MHLYPLTFMYMMKRLLFVLATVGLMVGATVGMALAEDPTTGTGDATFILPKDGSRYTLSADSHFESFAIANDSFSFVLNPGSRVTLSSADRKTLNNSLGIATTCEASRSIITLPLGTVPPEAARQTVTITPGSACSMIGATPSSVTVLAPNGGETLQEGQQYTIRWSSANIPANTSLSIDIYNGMSATILNPNTTIVAGLPANATSYTWTVSSNNGWGIGNRGSSRKFAAALMALVAPPRTNQYMIGVRARTATGEIAYDQSDAPFSIVSAGGGGGGGTATSSITVLAPNGGEQLTPGAPYVIRWRASNFPTSSTFYIELRPGGNNSSGVISRIAVAPWRNDSYLWQIPSSTVSGQYRVEIYKADQNGNVDQNESIKDVSDAPFTIVPVAPGGGGGGGGGCATNPQVPVGDQPPGDEPPCVPIVSFDRDLFFGMRNDPDVSNLQEFLIDQGFLAPPASGNYFILTKKAVQAFQSAHGLRPTGYFGPLTRAVANRILAGGSGGVTAGISVSASNLVPDQNISVGVAGSPLGAFHVVVSGGAVAVRNAVFKVQLGGAPGNGIVTDIDNVVLLDQSGRQLAGPIDVQGENVGPRGTLSFNDTFTLPNGASDLILKGTIGREFASDQTITLNTNLSVYWSVFAQGSGEPLSTLPNQNVSAHTVTVKTVALRMSLALFPHESTKAAGAVNVTMARFLLDATGSSEDVRVSGINTAQRGTGLRSGINTCKIVQDQGAGGVLTLTTGFNIANPVEGTTRLFTFDTPQVIPKGSTLTVDLVCNVAINAAVGSTYGWDLAPVQSLATGAITGARIDPVLGNAAGPLFTVVGTGRLSVALDASSPSSRLVAGGRSNELVTVLRLTTSGEAMNLNKIGLRYDGTRTDDIVKATIWDGNTQVAQAVFAGSSIFATATFSERYGLPQNDSKVFFIKVDVVGVGITGANSGDTIAINFDGATNPANTEAVGLNSGLLIHPIATVDTHAPGVRIMKSVPTVSIVPLPTTRLVTGRNDLMRFKITAGPQGDVSIGKVTYRTIVSGASDVQVFNTNIYAFVDQNYSTIASGVQLDGALSSINDSTVDTGSSLHEAGGYERNLRPENSAGAPTAVIIPAGGTRYFEVRGDVVTAGTRFGVSTSLQGDAALVPVGTFGSVDASPENDFIWSDNAITTRFSPTTPQWANGYLVSGLPNTGTASQTLTQ